MQSDDYKLTPSGSLGGKIAVSQNDRFLAEFTDTDQAMEFIREHMESNQFWPSVYWVSDHGNYWPIDLEGNEIVDSSE